MISVDTNLRLIAMLECVLIKANYNNTYNKFILRQCNVLFRRDLKSSRLTKMEARWLDFPAPSLAPAPVPPPLLFTVSPPVPLGPLLRMNDGESERWLDWGATVVGFCQESLAGLRSRPGVDDVEGVFFIAGVLGVWPCGFLISCT